MNTCSVQSNQFQTKGRQQRAEWTIGVNKSTTMETGLYNVTEDETAVLVHFGTEQTQQWLMVRLEEPAEESEG